MDKRALEITIACFLWNSWCDPFGVDYVDRLYRGVKRNLSMPFRFVCITDERPLAFDKGVKILHLDVPDWQWNLKKMFLYKPNNGLWGRVLAFDLDVVITGSLDDIARYQGDFATCEAAYHPGRAGGSLLGFDLGSNEKIGFLGGRLYEPLLADSRRVENKTGGSERKWLNYQLENKMDFWQKLFPDQVVSYKVDCKYGLPEDARVVRFHGNPRPHSVNYKESWMQEHWI